MIIRLLNLVIFLISIFLVLTGLRIYLFNESITPLPIIGWIDSLQTGGNVINQHLVLGYWLAGLLIVRLLVGIWNWYRYRSRKSSEPLPLAVRLKEAVGVGILTLLAASIFSGIMVYTGKMDSALVFTTIKNIHTNSFFGLLLLTLFYLGIFVVTKFKKYQRAQEELLNAVSDWIATGVSALLAMLVVIAVFVYAEKPAKILSKNIHRGIIVDGQARGIEWVGTDSLMINVMSGDNFPNEMTQLKMKSFHNFQYMFFLFQWPDPEPSFNRSLIKSDSGWIELKSEYSPFGESVYFEDQLAISFHDGGANCVQSCHLGNSSKAGSHYTKGDTADLWVWKSVSTNPASEADDGWWGASVSDTVGGRHFDNSAGGGYTSNLNEEWDEPYFLPSHHIFDNWIWMQSNKYIPYRSELDKYQIGAMVPGVLSAQFAADRSDLYSRGQWRSGMWTLELSRMLHTGSPFDKKQRGEITIGLAVFNNSELKHAYHLRSVRLEVEQ